ncbi:MAG: hypothetical protein RL654_2118, partial [Pseudomonadota bacterium]
MNTPKHARRFRRPPLRTLMLLPLASIATVVTAPARAQDAVPPALPAPVPQATLERVEIRASRPDESRERRQATAAKTVIGREELERQGDATVTEVLRRQPGVTLDGRPGRGGNPRLRGLGSGYTQILINGE